MNLTLSVVQMDTVLADKAQNLAKAERLIRRAARAGAQLVIVPELFNTGYRLDERYAGFAEQIPGPTVEKLGTLAADENLFIAACIAEIDPASGAIFDTAFLVSPQGLLGRYRKVHRWGREPEFFTPGEAFPVFETPWGRVGLLICYDVGFPEAARSLALAGAELILVPSAFGLPRLYAWDLATRARALENGCFLAAANRIGSELDSTFCGHSRIVDPQGTVIVDAGLRELMLVATIDLSEVAAQRGRIPYLRDRLPEAYRSTALDPVPAHSSSEPDGVRSPYIHVIAGHDS